MTEVRPKVVPAVYVLLRRGDKIFLMLRQNTSYYPDHYAVPSGHVVEGESPTEAAVRETREEAGVDIERGKLVCVHSMYRAKTDLTGDRADYFFEVEDWEGEPFNGEPEKCQSVGWFALEALPENLVPNQRSGLEAIRKGIRYSELDFGL